MEAHIFLNFMATYESFFWRHCCRHRRHTEWIHDIDADDLCLWANAPVEHLRVSKKYLIAPVFFQECRFDPSQANCATLTSPVFESVSTLGQRSCQIQILVRACIWTTCNKAIEEVAPVICHQTAVCRSELSVCRP